MRCASSAVLVCTLLVVAGCAPKLKYEKSLTIRPGQVHELIFDEPLVDKATITVKSPGAPVSVYIVYTTQSAAAMRAMENQQEPKDKITGAKSIEDQPFDIAPGKKPFHVLISPVSKEADVKVTATGK